MTRGEFWRLSYRARRYLSHLSVDELAKRSQDVLANVSILTPQGQIGLRSPKETIGYPWMELWTHIIEEFGSREMGMPPDILDPETIPNPTAPIPAKGFLESQGLKKELSGCLVKYGKRSWLTRTLAKGEWRISPASYYSDATLSKARRDSELEFHIRAANLEKTSKPVEGMEGQYYHVLKDVFAIDIKAATNYYLVCLARGLIYRMFDDFDADACLIIHNEDEFVRRMLRAFAAINPRWFGTFKAVDYIDPCMPRLPIDVHFAKHFRYSYQEEVRFVWTPLSPSLAKLSQFTINLGPIDDICELLLLNGKEFAMAGG
ncbi:MAG: hypothetical protein ABSG60_06950 [Terracidiphilus sp.]|jgi:hypothetical protein